MVPWKNFENLRTVMAIIVLFKQFLEKVICTLSASPMMHFVRTVLIMHA